MDTMISLRKNRNLIIPCGILITILCLFDCFKILQGISDETIVNFSYPSFDSQDKILTLGNASIYNNTLQLSVDGLPHSTGRALYSEAVKIWDRSTGLALSFSTSFNLSVTVLDIDHYGDGMAFGLFPDKTVPGNSTGEYLGLTNSTGGNSFVAVEFDLFKNDYDLNSNHAGVDLNSTRSACSSDLTEFGVRLKAGNEIFVQIDYDGFSRLFNVYAVNSSLGNPMDNLVLSCVVNISAYVPEEVFVGFSAATGSNGQYHTVHSWSFSVFSGHSSGEKKKEILGISLGVSVLGVGILIAALFYWSRTRRARKICTNVMAPIFRPISQDLRSNPTSDLSKEIKRACDWDVFPRKFTYEELSRATHDFDAKGLLGEGGFGDVYKGMICLENSCRYIAVKRFSQASNQSDREYLAEVAIIGRLRHRNLVQLQGWCHDRGELLLVYDYMPNGSVDQLLYEPKHINSFSWPQRLKTCRGLAAALLYLHEECHHKVVHRDVKTSNVMVDSDYEARLGDFGLARFVENNYSSNATSYMTSIGGTLGYIAPERSLTGKATLESDVFSYGAVLLEIASGRRPLDFNSSAGEDSILVDRIWKLVIQNRLLDAADPKLGGLFDEEEMERVLTVGLLCSSPEAKDRPTIRQALRILNYEAPLPVLPAEKPVGFEGHGGGGFEVWDETKGMEIESPWKSSKDGNGASITDVSLKTRSSAQSFEFLEVR